MNSLNQDIFLNINHFAGQNHTVDFLMILIAQYIPYLFLGLLFYLWFTHRQNEALYSGYTATLGVVINQIIGIFYFHPRPFMDNLGFDLLSHKPETSFPSDHTTLTLSIALMLLTFKSTRILGIIASIFALWCGVARVYCGVHYPFDILGSIVVAICALIVVHLFKNRLLDLNNYIISIYNSIYNKIIRVSND